MSAYHSLPPNAQLFLQFLLLAAVFLAFIWLVKQLSDRRVHPYQNSLDQANREYARSYHKPRTVAHGQPTQTATEPPSSTALRTAEGGQVVHMRRPHICLSVECVCPRPLPPPRPPQESPERGRP